MKAIQSLLGVINVDWEQGVINPDGTLNEYAWKLHCWNHAECRVDGTREMMWLGESLDNAPASPFLLKGKKYDLTKPNGQYFKNLKRMIEIAHEYGLEFIYVLFDYCGVKKSSKGVDRSKFNPWTNNVQGIKGFHKTAMIPYAKDYIYAVHTCKPDKVYVCNEPTYGYGPLLIRSFEQLVDLGWKWEDIIIGAQHVEEDEMNGDKRKLSHPYWVWKQYRKTHGGDALKDDVMLSLHGFTEDDHIFEGVRRGEYVSRRFWLSRDGVYPRPSAEENEEFLKSFRAGGADNFLDDGEEWYIEALNNSSHFGQGDEGLGFALALGRKYKKYPKPKPDPVPEPEPIEPKPDPVEPEPVEEEIMMKDIFDFENYWKDLGKKEHFRLMTGLLTLAGFALGALLVWIF